MVINWYLLFRRSFIIFIVILLPLLLKSQSLLEHKVDLEFSVGSTQKLLKHIEKESGLVLSYSNKVCSYNKVVLQSKSGTIKQFLDQIFINCPVRYHEMDGKILILPIDYRDLNFSVKGFIKDSITGEVLISANIYDVNGNKGVVSNDYGFFNFVTNGGEIILGSSYVGYTNQFKRIRVTKDTLIQFNLSPQPSLMEVPVVGIDVSYGLKSTQISVIDVPVRELQNVPSFFGEMDLVKMIQLFPGVKSGNEGLSSLYVRGGGMDQNLILLDEVPIYNMEHLLGFFSVFNSDAINSVKLIKGGFPAKYGGRLSSVLDIKMLEGNKDKLRKNVSLGLLSSKLAIDGPLIKDRTTYSISFRRTYYDLIASQLQSKSNNNSNYYFFDINAKANHQFSEKSRLFFTGYWGHDDLSSTYNFKDVSKAILSDDLSLEDINVSDEVFTGWGNVISSLRWNYVYNNRMFSNVTMALSNFDFYTTQKNEFVDDEEWNTITQKYKSGIVDVMLKGDFDYFHKGNHHIKFGGSLTNHHFYPGIEILQSDYAQEEKQDTIIGGEMIEGNELHFYIQNDFIINSQLKMNAGIHSSVYFAGTKKYFSIEPRILCRYLVSPKFALKTAYSTMTQYIHLLSTASVSLPSDLWLPVTAQIKPMEGWQISLQGNYEFLKGFNTSLEMYYKKNFNEIDYKESQSFFDSGTSWEDKITTGQTTTYGLEFLTQRTIGKWSGWIGYTYSKSESEFSELNAGKPFRANNDRRHDMSIFLSRSFSNQIDANLTWSYISGKPITLPDEKYYSPTVPNLVVEPGYTQSYAEKNGYTMPSYHRLDVGLNFSKDKEWGKRVWSIGVMNAYGKQNPFFMYFSKNLKQETSLKQFSLFPFPFPYIRYTIQF